MHTRRRDPNEIRGFCPVGAPAYRSFRFRRALIPTKCGLFLRWMRSPLPGKRTYNSLKRRVGGGFAPDPMAEPFVVVFHHSALRLGLVDPMAESFVDNHLGRDAFVL